MANLDLTTRKSELEAAVPVSNVSNAVKPAPALGVPPTETNQARQAGIEIPDGCNFVKGNSAFTVAICQPPREPMLDKLLVNTPSIILSLVALGISFWTFKYNRGKDARSRAQSIKDDFWIRKIISPVSVEPFLKYTTELAGSLPVVPTTEVVVQEFWKNQVKKITELSFAFRMLGLVDAGLDADVAAKWDEFEDHLATYCGALQIHLANANAALPDRSEATRNIFNTALSILRLIEIHQRSV